MSGKDWSRWIRVSFDESRRELLHGPRSRLDAVRVARAYDVPPWLVDPTMPRPRLWRARWRLRRIWPDLMWPS